MRGPSRETQQHRCCRRILKDTPTSATEVNPGLPRDLGKIIRRCLNKDPIRRYQTAIDLRNELEELKQEVDSGEVLEGAPPTKSRPNNKWTLHIALVVAIVVAGIMGYQLRLDEVTEETTGPPIQGTLTQLTSAAGVEQFPSLSPDGRFVAYTSQASGNWDIYILRVGGTRPMNLTEDSEVTDGQPAFSPDGEWIAFRSARDGGGLFVMGATGESVKRVTDFGFNPAWSPDGKQIVFSTDGVASQSRGGGEGQLHIADIETGEVRAIEIDGDAVQPSWYPNGHRIAFWSNSLSRMGSAIRDIWTISVSGGEPTPVTNDDHIDWNPVWSPDGTSIYFASNRAGTMSLWRIAVDEETGAVRGPPELVTSSVAADAGQISLSREDMRIAYRARVSRRNLQKIGFDPNSGVAVGEPISVTRGSVAAFYPDVSPDGELLAFSYDRDITVSKTDGSSLRQLTDDLHWDFAPRWSPDGSQLVFYSNRGGVFDLWAINLDGSGLRQLTEVSEGRGFTEPAWSADGRLSYNRFEGGVYIFDPDTPWNRQTVTTLPPFEERTSDSLLVS